MCFTWPTLEAMVSEGEPYAGLQRNVGIYNVVWAGTGALAFFIGGAMIEKFGLNSLFFVPIAVQLAQLALTFRLQRMAGPSARADVGDGASAPEGHPPPRSASQARTFLRLAWLANPFAYMAINTLVAVMPGVARRLELSTAQAGFYGSLWFFARLFAFLGLWHWAGWHYRFRWLLTAYLALVASFAVILAVPNLAALVGAQLVFGGAVGLIYYSSLFYSMDVGETKGEHGGIHEAAIGLGNFAGPAVGAAALHFFPQPATNGVWAVSALLVCGCAGLLAIWRQAK
jgi:predicted MFS family arabinose efflux permease